MIAYETTTPGAPLSPVERETPRPVGTQVLLRTVACGVCHSDIHLHDGAFALGDGKTLDVAQSGQVLGHEIFGEVVATGPDAQGVNVGDRRVVYPWIGCGQCAACQRGDEHLCTPGQALGIVRPGGFADHVLVPHGRYLFAKGNVPDALAATYACSGLTAYSALKKLGEPGALDRVVIIGAGGVGMMAIQIALSVFGIQPIVVDIDEQKLAAVRQLGVETTFNSSDPQTAKVLRKSCGGAYAVIDFVGAEASVNYGLGCLRKGGRLLIVGLYGGSLTLPIPFIPMNARIIQGSYVGKLQEMDELMGLVRDGRIAPIEIHERPLAEVSEALTDLKAGRVKGRQVLMNY
ncbi:MAG: alcohol dehydrogenase [Gammaproteobacteria bacterium]|nr:alcohol dehydrogenase catalytic domain-containing protein [Pseudomonadales bacterium]MCP5345436.1 alcohol dehydrogenase catalytic domain-containing protein [Pseudomonadales bacterium]